jgi:putative transcriptional regulator
MSSYCSNPMRVVLRIQVIIVKLREEMAKYSKKYSQKITYSDIAKATGLSKSTLEAIGSRGDYNPTLSTIDLLCAYFDCDVGNLLEYEP